MTHAVLIITLSRPAELRRALEALARQTSAPDEVWIVGAGAAFPGEDVPSVDANDAPWPFRLQLLHSEPGMARQRNAGLDRIRTDIITFLDDDAIPDPGYCAAVLHAFSGEEGQSLAGVGASIETRATVGGVALLMKKVFFLQTDRGGGRFRLSGIPDFSPATPQTRAVDVLPSTAFSFRRSAVADLRFDAAVFSGAAMGLSTGRCFGEDAWFSAMLAGRGELRQLADARVRHEPSPASRENVDVTRALYVYAMRVLSARFAVGFPARAARAWALAGLGLQSVAQSLLHADRGYAAGFLRALRAPLRLPA